MVTNREGVTSVREGVMGGTMKGFQNVFDEGAGDAGWRMRMVVLHFNKVFLRL